MNVIKQYFQLTLLIILCLGCSSNNAELQLKEAKKEIDSLKSVLDSLSYNEKRTLYGVAHSFEQKVYNTGDTITVGIMLTTLNPRLNQKIIIDHNDNFRLAESKDTIIMQSSPTNIVKLIPIKEGELSFSGKINIIERGMNKNYGFLNIFTVDNN